MHGHEWGTCVCVEGGGGGALVAAKWDPCRFQHQYLQCGAPVYPLRVTLFSEGLGTAHHGGGHHSYIVGTPCERYGALGVISVSSEPKPSDILDSGGGGCFFVLFVSESLGKRWDRSCHYSSIVGTH